MELRPEGTFDLDQLCISRAALEEVLARELGKQAELISQLVAEVRALRSDSGAATVPRFSQQSQETGRSSRGSKQPKVTEHLQKMALKGAECRASRKSSPAEAKDVNMLARLVSSSEFTYSVMALICVNMILLGLQVDAGSFPPYQEPGWYDTVNSIIVVIFVCELALKLAALGCKGFFCGRDRAWNIFDLVIVVVSMAENVLELAINLVVAAQQADSNHLRFLRVAKIARALRGVRVMRLLRYISSLRAILFSISSTMWSLFWTLVLLLLLFYCFGVLVGQVVIDHCSILYSQDHNAICDQDLVQFWGTVPECMLTLFMSISGGLSWNDAFMPLRRVSEIAAVAMVLYIIIAVFAVLNVVTGVFSNTAIENAKADKDIAIMKQMQKHRAQVEALQSVFNDIDCNQSALLSIAELEEATKDMKFKSFMESMDISVKDIWTLFMLIDADESGEITVDEFVSGCMQLEGPAKSLHLARLRSEVLTMKKDIQSLCEEMRSRFDAARPSIGRTWT